MGKLELESSPLSQAQNVNYYFALFLRKKRDFSSFTTEL